MKPVTLVVVSCLLLHYTQGHRIGQDPNRRGAYLDVDNRYLLEWTVDRVSSRITFNLTVETQGWILLGLANNASETTGRDIVVAGVGASEVPYIWDGHTTENNTRLLWDASQDYRLEDYDETSNHTFISISRFLDTCDEYDYPLTENKVTLIWAVGTADSERSVWNRYLETVRDQGSYEIYLLDPEYTPQITQPAFNGPDPQVIGSDASSVKVWSVQITNQLPTNHTVQFASIHKAPRLAGKHHIIGFNVRFDNDISRLHTHHVFIFKCVAPQGSTARDLFEQYAQSGEQEICHNTGRPVVGRNMPYIFCSQMQYIWAVGARPFFVPDNVGFTLGENEEEYYMLQYHYDNPQMTAGLTATFKMDIFYTSILRPNDGGALAVGQDITGLPLSLLIPPKTSFARTFGHCSPECTRRMLPEGGITVVAGWLHSHLSGKQFRLRQFRGSRELPWPLYDDNFNHQFQPFRNLPRGPIKVLPGDQLTIDCIYDNTWTNGTVGGGYTTTNQEMCFTMLIYYNLIPDYSFCRSENISPEVQLRILGVSNVTWMEPHLDWVAIPPSASNLVGLNRTVISDTLVDWTADKRRELQEFHERRPHAGKCGRDFPFRDQAEIDQIVDNLLALQRSSGVRHLLIPDNEPTSVDTENDYIGPVEYPRDAMPYSLPGSRCLTRGDF